MKRFIPLVLAASLFAADDDYKPGPDSQPQPGTPKGQMIKGHYVAKEGSLFPGTERDYDIYLPPNLDTAQPAPFMVFQDGVIYQAPTVFDNLIAKKEIPAMIGIFIKPGVVPAANANALPRYNRSYEYDSVTDNYSRFLIDEFLPAITQQHKLNLSTDPNARAIAGNSSGGICAFMVAWHRPDQFRRVFTGVGTYVGIHGADQLPVLVRKYEPKPLRVFLQSGENDNNRYCGDWWMANQMMERSLTWNGYEVNHTWGTGGHNAKHATAIFPDVLRWLWKSYPNEPVKANPRGDAKWVGYEVIGDGGLEAIRDSHGLARGEHLASFKSGDVFYCEHDGHRLHQIFPNGGQSESRSDFAIRRLISAPNNSLIISGHRSTDSKVSSNDQWAIVRLTGEQSTVVLDLGGEIGISARYDGLMVGGQREINSWKSDGKWITGIDPFHDRIRDGTFVWGPDQTHLYAGDQSLGADFNDPVIYDIRVSPDGMLTDYQRFGYLDADPNNHVEAKGMCVDTNGWLYVATSLGIQVLDQAGRVNFIIPTPKQPHDVCFGGNDLSDLFIACGDTIYKRPTKAHGYVSGQMAPIKPPAPKL